MLSSTQKLGISTVMPRSRTHGRAANLCMKRSPRFWCTTLRHLPLITSYKCSARLYETKDLSGHGAIHAVLTKRIPQYSRNPWLACSSGMRGLWWPSSSSMMPTNLWSLAPWSWASGTPEGGPCRNIMHQRWSKSTPRTGHHTWISWSTTTRSCLRSSRRWSRQLVSQQMPWGHSVLGWMTYERSSVWPRHERWNESRMWPILYLEFSQWPCESHMVREIRP